MNLYTGIHDNSKKITRVIRNTKFNDMDIKKNTKL